LASDASILDIIGLFKASMEIGKTGKTKEDTDKKLTLNLTAAY